MNSISNKFGKLISKISKPVITNIPQFEEFNELLLETLEQPEKQLATDSKSEKESLDNNLDSGMGISNKSSTGRKPEGIMEDEMFQDFGNDMDIIMENMYENFTKTNNMFSSLGVDMESGIDNMTLREDDNVKINGEFQNEFFNNWNRKDKKVKLYFNFNYRKHLKKFVKKINMKLINH